MRTIRYLLILFLCSIILAGCYRTEFLHSTSSFYVLNQTSEDVKISYVITNPYNHVVDSNICILPAKEATRLPIDSLTSQPSILFNRMVFLSQDDDTLKVISSINDSDWGYSQGMIEYGGYIIKELRWLYRFNK
jgi:hypothetical protein